MVGAEGGRAVEVDAGASRAAPRLARCGELHEEVEADHAISLKLPERVNKPGVLQGILQGVKERLLCGSVRFGNRSHVEAEPTRRRLAATTAVVRIVILAKKPQ